MSEAHLRQMALFRERPNQIMTDYSRQFEAGFVGILRIRGRQRILANSVYQEYIADRHHIHMKATQWDSLSTFVQYLGRTGQAEVDETERGWYIKYIDRDPKVVARQQAEARSQKIALDDVQLTEKLIERQIEESKHIEKERGRWHHCIRPKACLTADRQSRQPSWNVLPTTPRSSFSYRKRLLPSRSRHCRVRWFTL